MRLAQATSKLFFECKKLKEAMPKNPTDDPAATVRWLKYCVYPFEFKAG